MRDRQVRRREVIDGDHGGDQAGALGALGRELDGDRHPAGLARRGGELGDRVAAHDDPRVGRLGDARDLVDLGRRHHDDVVGRRHPDLDLVDQDLELELGEQLVQRRQVPLADDEVVRRPAAGPGAAARPAGATTRIRSSCSGSPNGCLIEIRGTTGFCAIRLASVPYWSSRLAAVLSPTPRIPGMLSLVSPTSARKSGIFSGGTPIFLITSSRVYVVWRSASIIDT
jgi:hypothetical protein